jgi:hypothetical protein
VLGGFTLGQDPADGDTLFFERKVQQVVGFVTAYQPPAESLLDFLASAPSDPRKPFPCAFAKPGDA